MPSCTPAPVLDAAGSVRPALLARRAAALLCCAALLAPAAPAQSPPPGLVDFQARLTDSGGVPLAGAVTMTMSVYATATGGAPLWLETHDTTALAGVVNLQLGSSTALPLTLFEQGELYLAVRIGTDAEMTPRRRLASVPFTLRASRVERIDLSTTIDPDTIARPNIQLDAIDSSRLQDGEVLLADLAVDSVDSARICNGGVAQADIATDAVDSAIICNGSVALADMGADAVNSAVVCDGSVALADMGADAVNSAVICNASVSIADMGMDAVNSAVLCDSSVALADMAADAVNSLVLCNGSVALADMSVDAVDSMVICNGSVASEDLALWAVEGEALAPQGVLLSKLSAAGALPGQVPKFTGSDVTWADDEAALLALPFAGGAGTPANTAAFEITQSLAGPAIKGIFADPSLDGFGVHGRTLGGNGSAGVYGESLAQADFTYGVLGHSEADLGSGGAGVLGTSGFVGVEGQATVGSGEALGRLGVADTLTASTRRGVHGSARLGSENYGVSGEADGGSSGSKRFGVFGHGLGAANGDVYGVYGRATAGPGTRYGVFSDGNFGGTGAKYFVQPHPTDPAQEVRFVCLEGPESGTYFRGTGVLAGGRAVIEVPESFRLVSDPDGLSVQLTAVGAPALLWVESQDLDTLVVRGEPDVRFHYLVHGVRRGFADHEALQPNSAFVPGVRGLPFGAALRPAQRQLLVENGTLNADFTPNEAMAAAQGWPLRDPTPAELAAAER
jgi:hypothetical protein